MTRNKREIQIPSRARAHLACVYIISTVVVGHCTHARYRRRRFPERTEFLISCTSSARFTRQRRCRTAFAHDQARFGENLCYVLWFGASVYVDFFFFKQTHIDGRELREYQLAKWDTSMTQTNSRNVKNRKKTK